MVMSLTAKRLRLPFPYGFLWSLDTTTKGIKTIECPAEGELIQWKENSAKKMNVSLSIEVILLSYGL